MTKMHWKEAIKLLELGEIRSANKVHGKWEADIAVKESILEAFKEGKLIDYTDQGYPGFFDKESVPTQTFSLDSNVRIVPGGSSIRVGSYIAEGVIVVPPSYINIGAYVDTGTMVDSHVLVGSCAQIGKNVHLSAGVQIGGVLEPIGLTPVIIEDDAFIGAGSIIVEGVQVSKRAIIAPGVVLSQGVPVYDCINERVLPKGEAIPENAIVVPGTRPINSKLSWASSHDISINCALINKYRDSKTDASIELEEYLR